MIDNPTPSLGTREAVKSWGVEGLDRKSYINRIKALTLLVGIKGIESLIRPLPDAPVRLPWADHQKALRFTTSPITLNCPDLLVSSCVIRRENPTRREVLR